MYSLPVTPRAHSGVMIALEHFEKRIHRYIMIGSVQSRVGTVIDDHRAEVLGEYII